MVYTSDTLFNNVTDTLKNLNFFQNGTNFIVILAIVVICAIMISPRKISNVKLLLLPLCVGFTIIGLKVPMLFMVLAGILFIMETLTTKIIGDVLEVAKQTVSTSWETGSKIYGYATSGEQRQIKKYENVKKQQKKDRFLNLMSNEDYKKYYGKDRITVTSKNYKDVYKDILRTKNKEDRDKMSEEFMKFVKKKRIKFEVNE